MSVGMSWQAFFRFSHVPPPLMTTQRPLHSLLKNVTYEPYKVKYILFPQDATNSIDWIKFTKTNKSKLPTGCHGYRIFGYLLSIFRQTKRYGSICSSCILLRPLSKDYKKILKTEEKNCKGIGFFRPTFVFHRNPGSFFYPTKSNPNYICFKSHI